MLLQNFQHRKQCDVSFMKIVNFVLQRFRWKEEMYLHLHYFYFSQAGVDGLPGEMGPKGMPVNINFHWKFLQLVHIAAIKHLFGKIKYIPIILFRGFQANVEQKVIFALLRLQMHQLTSINKISAINQLTIGDAGIKGDSGQPGPRGIPGAQGMHQTNHHLQMTPSLTNNHLQVKARISNIYILFTKVLKAPVENEEWEVQLD